MYQTGCISECPERKSSENKVIHAKNEVEEVEYVSKKEKHTFSSDFLPNHWLHLFF